MPLTSSFALLAVMGLVVVVLTRVRLRNEDEAAGLAKVSPLVVNLHTLTGLVGEVLFLDYLLDDLQLGLGREVAGQLGVGLLVVTALCGIAILLRWLPSGGRHSSEAHDDSWAAGPGLSIVAHGGMAAAVALSLAAFVSNRI